MCGFLSKKSSSPTPAVVNPAPAVKPRDQYQAPADVRDPVVEAAAGGDGREASGRVKLGRTARRGGGAAVGLTI